MNLSKIRRKTQNLKLISINIQVKYANLTHKPKLNLILDYNTLIKSVKKINFTQCRNSLGSSSVDLKPVDFCNFIVDIYTN